MSTTRRSAFDSPRITVRRMPKKKVPEKVSEAELIQSFIERIMRKTA